MFDLSVKPLEYGPNELSDWYVNSFDEIIQATIDFRNDFPYETTTLLCELIRSDYALNFIAGTKTILKSSPRDWNIHEKVRFVRDSYESIYQNFAFISFAIKYKTEGTSNLRSDWFYPYKAKDKINKGSDNWVVGSENVTGKQFVLQNSKLFDWLTSNYKELLKNVRNGDSHYKTLIIEDSVFLLDGINSEEITDSVEFLCEYLFACHKIMYELYSHLLISHRFWILPSVLLTFSHDFKYKKRDVVYNLLQSIFDKVQKRKIEKNAETPIPNPDDDLRKSFLFFGVLMHAAIIVVWDILEENKELINNLLLPISMQISIAQMRDMQKEAVVEILNIFRLSSAKIEQFIAKNEVVFYEELKIQDYENIDLLNEIDSYMNSLKKALKTNEKSSLMLFTILPAAMSLVIPLGKLHNEFKEIFIPLTNGIT